MKPGDRLLWLAARVTFDEDSEGELRALASGVTNWRRVLYKAERAQLVPLLYVHLRRYGLLQSLPAWAATYLQRSFAANQLRNAVALRHLRAVALALSTDGSPPVLLKGAAALVSLYPYPGMRQMCDVDLHIRAEYAERGAAALIALGFEPGPQEAPTKGSQGFILPLPEIGAGESLTIELHWHLLDQEEPVYLDRASCEERMRETRVAGVPALVLGPEDTLHHLSAHLLFHHHYAPDHQMRGLCDIAGVLQRYHSAGIDWDYLAASADRYNTTAALYIALSALHPSLQSAETRGLCAALHRSLERSGSAALADAVLKCLPRVDYCSSGPEPVIISRLMQAHGLRAKVAVLRKGFAGKRSRTGGPGARLWRTARKIIGAAAFWLLAPVRYDPAALRLAYLLGKLRHAAPACRTEEPSAAGL